LPGEPEGTVRVQAHTTAVTSWTIDAISITTAGSLTLTNTDAFESGDYGDLSYGAYVAMDLRFQVLEPITVRTQYLQPWFAQFSGAMYWQAEWPTPSLRSLDQPSTYFPLEASAQEFVLPAGLYRLYDDAKVSFTNAFGFPPTQGTGAFAGGARIEIVPAPGLASMMTVLAAFGACRRRAVSR
jgi:hypothetical protein